jgi:hypothetical protein
MSVRGFEPRSRWLKTRYAKPLHHTDFFVLLRTIPPAGIEPALFRLKADCLTNLAMGAIATRGIEPRSTTHETVALNHCAMSLNIFEY